MMQLTKLDLGPAEYCLLIAQFSLKLDLSSCAFYRAAHCLLPCAAKTLILSFGVQPGIFIIQKLSYIFHQPAAYSKVYIRLHRQSETFMVSLSSSVLFHIFPRIFYICLCCLKRVQLYSDTHYMRTDNKNKQLSNVL